ncbi:MAG: sodium:panthothenate symporter [Lentisphaerae bacterium]|nr:sodium:panthothenate symporter [Lentisphaerota bacterium]
MSWIDWLIMLVPLAFVMYMGFYSTRYVKGVSDYMVAGRCCRRYVISTANMANALALVGLVSYIESHYRTGFAMTFWNSAVVVPLGTIVVLSGWCLYRFRETRAMSLGQFLEIRYNRSLRIFACFLRSVAEIMANIIMPAIAARFFISYLGLPQTFNLFGWQCPTFLLIVALTLFLAITLIYIGGTLSIVITDTIQGIIFFPTVLTFIIFVLCKFDWLQEIVPVISDRVAGESFINPFDVYELRDFNLFQLITIVMATILHAASGVTGSNNAAISAHEAKMGSILGSWRGSFSTVCYVLFSVMIITLLNHTNYSTDARQVRNAISTEISEELIVDPAERTEFVGKMESIPEFHHRIGIDPPPSQKVNQDQVYFDKAQEHFGKGGEASYKTQQFKTIFRQLMLPATMRHVLPPGLIGLFAMMIVLFILSSDDSRIYSASSTLVQDCIVPFYKNETLSPQKHIFYIKFVSILVGVIFLLGSYFMAQLDYISLFVNIMYGMWMGGCGPMILFGFYSRFGTSAGAWSSLLSGMFINFFGIFMQRCWAKVIYPFLDSHNWVEPVGNFLETVSSPFNPIIRWEMNPLKCPINSYEFYFLAMVTSLVVYLVVSKLTCREPFNLDRMLYRGKYAMEDVKKPAPFKWSVKNVLSRLVGISPEYTRGDKIIAWTVFSYSFIFQFVISVVIVLIWNLIYRWPNAWWGYYFLIVFMIVPAICAAVTTVWFGFGATRDLLRLFRDLGGRENNPLDNGMVEGHLSLMDKAKLEALDEKADKAEEAEADK